MESLLAVLASGFQGLFVLAPLLFCSSLPPKPEDPALARVAPQECMLYCSWAGTTAADANSKNRAERFLAEPEIVRVRAEAVSHLKRLVQSAIKDLPVPDAQANQKIQEFVSQDLPVWGELLTTEPGALFISRYLPERQPVPCDGGLVLSIGNAQTRVAKSLQRLQQLAPTVEEVREGESVEYRLKEDTGGRFRWGLRGKYLIVTFGTESPAAIAQRMKGQEPSWFRAITRNLPIERRAGVIYAPSKPILALAARLQEHDSQTATPNGGPGKPATSLPQWSKQLRSVTVVAGLDKEDYVCRVLVELDPAVAPLLQVLAHRPLRPEDLASIPRDASLALATRVDPRILFGGLQWLLHEGAARAAEKTSSQASSSNTAMGTAGSLAEMAGAVLPGSVASAFSSLPSIPDGCQTLDALLGGETLQDLIASLGDAWCVYVAPSEGMFWFTGATFTVSVRDHDRLAKALQRLAAQRQPAESKKEGPGQEKSVDWAIRKARFAEHDVYYTVYSGEGAPITVAWCLTDKRLVVSSSPTCLKAYLLRQADRALLAETPAVMEVLQAPEPPTAIAYQDTEQPFRMGYPFLQLLADFFNAQRSMLPDGADPMLVPAAPTIAKYLKPAIASVEVTSKGVIFTNRESLPGGNLSATLMTIGCSILPAASNALGSYDRKQVVPAEEVKTLAKEPQFDVVPQPTFIETKEGTCTLKSGQGPGAEAAFTYVHVGNKIKGSYGFRLTDFFGKKALAAPTDFKNTSDRPVKYELHVAFFDKAGKLVGTDHRQCFQFLPPGENSQGGARDGTVILTIEGAAETIASYKLVYYEFEKPAAAK
jgi:hypothetical protein